MTISFRPATRENVALMIGLAGASGSGKTFSAMRLAKGIAGDKPFAVIDTEAGRAKHYADTFRFDHADLKPPFTPDAYAEAIAAADTAGYPVIVVDSFSHEHAGEGGMLDMHEAEYQRLGGRDSVKMTAWIKPKGAHRRMVSRLLQIRAHMILCLRAEEKIDMVKNQDGKIEIVPEAHAGRLHRLGADLREEPPVRADRKFSLDAGCARRAAADQAPGAASPVLPSRPDDQRASGRGAGGVGARGGERADQRAGSQLDIGRAPRSARPWSPRSGCWRTSAAGPSASASRRGGSSVAGRRSDQVDLGKLQRLREYVLHAPRPVEVAGPPDDPEANDEPGSMGGD